MHDTGCLGLVHWDDPEGWYGEGGGRRVQDGVGLALGSPIFPSGCEGKLGVALESLQGCLENSMDRGA